LAVSLLEKYGVVTPFSSPVIQQKSQETSKANHGGIHPLSDPAVIAARKEHLMALYGVDNISKVPAIKDKIIAKLLTNKDCGAVPSMNCFERKFSEMTPENIVYTGDWSYWVTWSNGRRKNPDFVVISPEQLALYKNGVPIGELRIKLVIEANGDFWHTAYRGLSRDQREAEFIEGYASIGISCLVIWESDLTNSPEVVNQRLQTFLGRPLSGVANP